MQDTKLIIWDMDGVKYHLTADFQSRYVQAVACAAGKLLSMPYEQAHAIALRGQQETNRAMYYFAEEYKLEYLTLGPLAEQEFDLGCLQPSPSFINKLNSSSNFVDHMVLTEGNPLWAKNVMTQLQLHDFYETRHVVTKAEYPEHSKKSSRVPFELALTRSGHLPEHSAMIEDTEHNLYIPKEMGMTTVLLSHDPHKKQTSKIDYIFKDSEDFLDHFISQQKPGLL